MINSSKPSKPQRSHPLPIAPCGVSESLTYIWEAATWEIVTWEVAFGKILKSIIVYYRCI